MAVNQGNAQNVVTPNGMAADEDGADRQNAVPQTGTPAGSGTGTQIFNITEEGDSTEFDDCLPEEAWELKLSMRGTSVRKIHPGPT